MAKTTTTAGTGRKGGTAAKGKAGDGKAEGDKTAAGKAGAAGSTAKGKTAAAGKRAAATKKAPAKRATTARGGAAKGSAGTASTGKRAAAKPAAAKASSAKASTTSTAGAAKRGASGGGKAGAAKAAAGRHPWLDSYPPGVPAEIAPPEHESIGALLTDSCRRFAARTAFTCMGKSITFGELDRLSADLGAYLQGKGLKKGARVAIMMPNILQYPVTMMAVLRAGYTVVNVNPLYTPRELEHQLVDSGAEAIVILENFASTLQAVVAKTKVKHVVVASMGDLMGLKGIVVNLVVRRVRKMVPAWSLPGHTGFNAALKEGARGTLAPVEVGADDVAFLQYTGGTTGVSKGATLMHRNVLANVAQNALWLQPLLDKRDHPDSLVYVCALPLYHIFALTVNALMGMQQGGHNVLIPNPRDIPAFVAELKKHRFNVFPGLNTLFNALLNNEDFRKLDFSGLILTVGGGMAVQRSVAERWKTLTGSTISEGYGLSETAPVATANRFDGEEFTGTIGLPLPSTEIAIRDDDGKDVALGEVGEICIRGPQVMAGYWNRPDETAKVMTEDGFFKSGDMGFMDERGYVKIVDRKKDMILVSGFNVYPNEIEDVAAQHPGVVEVAAVGVPDEHSGEVPKLFVVRRDDTLTEQALIDFCRDKLTGYKRPRHVEFRDELPKTNVGKILRRELR
ncbi:long-chain-fatty-acid--CoA ligase [Aquibium sp. A9E412]|uniref:long-chain-fatty-acid--CoA ligase n=1 Tax=Aquibium sp. A9E412 TaxID=2976767 RepID=UPI0025AF607D|nr:long-chain-fatty-acid--CoA ligase [Aquibium sp. A9E412]MDN2568547.1 long-chain-fatty-acid--CoA ligase [Aquibium sp. A9E412]